MNDEDICALIKAKNEKGLSLLMDKYGGLFVYITRNIGSFSEEDTAECVSDTLFTIWKRINKFDKTKASFKTWIVMIARGCAIDYLRKNINAKRTVPIDTVTIHQMEELTYMAYNEFDQMEYNQLIELLQELSPPDNHIFYRRFVLGMSVTEIADELNLTADNIYKRLSRGKEKLKDIIRREGCSNV